MKAKVCSRLWLFYYGIGSDWYGTSGFGVYFGSDCCDTSEFGVKFGSDRGSTSGFGMKFGSDWRGTSAFGAYFGSDGLDTSDFNPLQPKIPGTDSSPGFALSYLSQYKFFNGMRDTIIFI